MGWFKWTMNGILQALAADGYGQTQSDILSKGRSKQWVQAKEQ